MLAQKIINLYAFLINFNIQTQILLFLLIFSFKFPSLT